MPVRSAAYPDGAPWGAALASEEQNCASCHFGNEPQHDSSALRLEGLPTGVVPGQQYTLQLLFDVADTEVAGFQLLIESDGDPGRFVEADADIERSGNAVRSIATRPTDTKVRWEFLWEAPNIDVSNLRFHVAATAGNNDQSPFGDTTHFRVFELPAVEDDP